MNKCRHQALHFEGGGFYLVCNACGYAWQAVGAERNSGPDFEAITMSIRPGEERIDPFYVKPIKSKT